MDAVLGLQILHENGNVDLVPLTLTRTATESNTNFTGTVKGAAIEFSFTVDAQGQSVDVVYKGTVDGATTGMPAASMAFLAWILSPIRRITSGEGPMNSILQSRQIWANSARSERKP